MIGILLLTHRHIGRGLLEAAEHTLGHRPLRLELIEADYSESPERFAETLGRTVGELDRDDGVLILADVFGATHTNLACRLLRRGHIELVTGVNLPMLLRVLNYRNLAMDDLIDKALSGGCGGIVCAAEADRERGARS
jgi:PTS system ascorbate-specific IIA component